MSIKGFVFDFDGLILDTETPLFNVYQGLFAGYGVHLTQREWWKVIGTDRDGYDPLEHLTRVAGDHHDPAEFQKIIDAQVDRLLQQASPLPGAVDFIREAHARNIPMAVASSSSRSWVQGHLQRLNLLEYFQDVLTADDVARVKPDPELYRLASTRLRVTPQELVAFEDSFNGIQSAKAAGLICIAIPNEMTREMPLQIADRIVTSFTELQLEDVLALTANRNPV